MSGLGERHRSGRPIYGLPESFRASRWVSRDGGPGDLGLAHGEPRPAASPLITIGTLATRLGSGTIEPYDTFGQLLLMAERSRNDPAFQHDTMDPVAIAEAVESVPGPEAWRPITINVDGSPLPFLRQDRQGDWIAFSEIGDGELLWVHVEEPDDTSFEIVTISDAAIYQDLF